MTPVAASSSKKWIWIAIIVLVAVIGIRLMGGSSAPTAQQNGNQAAGNQEELVAADTSAAIEADLNSTDFGSLEAELKATDADLNSL